MNSLLLLSILSFYGILIVVNLPAPLLGLNFESGKKPGLWYAPPGFVIPIIWFVLFTLLGVGRYYLLNSGLGNYQWWLYTLALLCATYAYYTLGLARLTGVSALWFGLMGNIVVIVFACVVVGRLLPIDRATAFLVVPVIVWTIFASVIVIGELKMEKLW